MMDMVVGLAFMAVYVPVVGAYIWYADEMFDKIEAFVVKAFEKSEAKVDGSAGAYLAMFGEAVD
jgi:hypothetical protein